MSPSRTLTNHTATIASLIDDLRPIVARIAALNARALEDVAMLPEGSGDRDDMVQLVDLTRQARGESAEALGLLEWTSTITPERLEREDLEARWMARNALSHQSESLAVNS